MATSKELRESRAKIVKESRALLEKVKTEKRDMNSEEVQAFERMDADIEKYGAEIAAVEREERTAARESELEQRAGRVTDYERPGGHATTLERRASAEYRAAFDAWLRYGPSYETRALQAGGDVGGGFIVPPQQFVANLIKFVDNLVFFRKFATVYTVTSAQSLGAPSLDADPEDGDWTNELSTGTESTAMAFGKRELYPHPVAKRIKISNKLIQIAPQLQFSGSGFSVGNFGSQPGGLPPGNNGSLSQPGGSGAGIPGVGAANTYGAAGSGSAEDLVRWRLAYKFAVTEEKAFLNGTGVQQPLGLFTASPNGIDTSRDVSTGNTTTNIQADNLFEVLYSLKPQYQQRATWIFHRTTIKAIRQLKDGTGQYLWQPGIQAGQPDLILTRPYLQSEYAPNTYTTGSYIGLLGDLSFYWIADAEQMQVQRLVELYAEQNLIGFIGRLETDGMPVLAEAFARVKLA